MAIYISGIQQMGIGIPNVHEAFAWYRKAFGSDIKVFEEAATAKLMLPYTGGKPQERHAILALNLESGGGFEIWQYTNRTPQPPSFEVHLGDLGFNICKIKTRSVQNAYKHYRDNNLEVLSEILTDPLGKPHFFIKDPYNNIFQIVEGYGWFKRDKKATGLVFGAVIGVSNMEKSLKFYADILGYDTILYREKGVAHDFKNLIGGNNSIERVLLKHSKEREGAFSKLIGPSEIELVKVENRDAKPIFENRFWGDLGFIHLCFDIAGMDELKQKCTNLGYPFTVDSDNSFDMGEAAGRFAYIEDPDGALIEFVETHKVPIAKKWGWYLNLKNRDRKKPLPNWLIKAMRINRVKS